MTSRPWMPFYVSDTRAATEHMRPEAVGAYIRLVCNYWERAAPLPAEDRKLAAISGMTTVEWELVKGDVLDLFELRDGSLYHLQIDAEIEKAEERLSIARRAGQASSSRRKSNGSATPVEREFNGKATPVEQGSNESPTGVDREFNKNRTVQNIDTTLLRARDLSEQLCEAMGVTDETKTPGLISLSDPLNWLQEGCDLEADILPTLRSIRARKKNIQSWGYCSKAVFEARDRRLAPSTTSIVPANSSRGPHKPAAEKAHRNHTIIEALARISENDPNRPR